MALREEHLPFQLKLTEQLRIDVDYTRIRDSPSQDDTVTLRRVDEKENFFFYTLPRCIREHAFRIVVGTVKKK